MHVDWYVDRYRMSFTNYLYRIAIPFLKTGAIENKTCLCFHSLCKTFFEYHESLWRKFLLNFYVIQNVTTSSHFYNNRIVLKQLYFILLCVLLKIFMGMPIFSARLWAAPSIAVSSGEFNSNIWVVQAYQGLCIYK